MPVVEGMCAQPEPDKTGEWHPKFLHNLPLMHQYVANLLVQKAPACTLVPRTQDGLPAYRRAQNAIEKNAQYGIQVHTGTTNPRGAPLCTRVQNSMNTNG